MRQGNCKDQFWESSLSNWTPLLSRMTACLFLRDHLLGGWMNKCISGKSVEEQGGFICQFLSPIDQRFAPGSNTSLYFWVTNAWAPSRPKHVILHHQRNTGQEARVEKHQQRPSGGTHARWFWCRCSHRALYSSLHVVLGQRPLLKSSEVVFDTHFKSATVPRRLFFHYTDLLKWSTVL